MRNPLENSSLNFKVSYANGNSFFYSYSYFNSLLHYYYAISKGKWLYYAISKGKWLDGNLLSISIFISSSKFLNVS